MINLSTFMTIMAGGPGSGCNPQAGQCGRKPGWRKFNPNNVGGYFKRGTVIAHMYITLAGKNGQWHDIADFEERFKGTGQPVVMNRLRELANTGKKSGLWQVEFRSGQVRLIKADRQEPIARPMVTDKPAVERPKDLTEEEHTLATAPVNSSRNLGGGINEVVLLKLANGKTAVFKPEPDKKKLRAKGEGYWQPRKNITPGNTTGREYAAYQVAKLAGLGDLVPAMAVREVGGQRGIAMEFFKGYEAANATDPVDGKWNAARAAAFDYVIGNEDRHHGNWMVPNLREKNTTLRLIDHGLSFPNGPFKGRMGIMSAMLRKYAGWREDNGLPSPKELAEPYIKNKDAIVAAIKDNGLGDDVVAGVKERIQALGSTEKWYDLKAPGAWV